MSLKNPKHLLIIGAVVVALMVGTVLLGNYANILPGSSDADSQVKTCSAAKTGSAEFAKVCSGEKSATGCCPKVCPPDCTKPCCAEETTTGGCPMSSPSATTNSGCCPKTSTATE